MPRKPSRTIVLPYSTETTSKWTVAKVRKALDAHERGDFHQSAMLVDAFGRDDRIKACSTTRTNALTSRSGLTFEIVPSEDGPKARNKRLAADVDTWWLDAIPETAQARMLYLGIMLGVCVAKLDWSRGAEWVPGVRIWPMQHVSWDESTRRFAVNTQQGRILVDPDDPEWLLYTPYGYEEAWMGGLVRCLGLLFVLRQLSHRDWARFCERHGMPLIIIREPAVYAEEDKARFATEIENLGTNGIARLPDAGGDAPRFDIEYKEATDTGWQSFEAWGKRIDTSIAIVLLGQNLTTEVSGGSFAAAQVQDRVRIDYLASDAETMATTLREGMLKPWVTFNFGYPETQAPWPHWDATVPEDKKVIAETTKLAAESITAMQNAGVNVDYDALCERLGLPMKPGPALEEKPEEPEVPPPVPPADDEEEEAPPDDPSLSVRLASGDTATGFVKGQKYADKLVSEGTRAAQGALAPTIDELIRALSEASSFEEAQAAIVATYASANTTELEALSERLLILAQLAGRAAVVEDL